MKKSPTAINKQLSTSRILISGSLVYDTIFDLHGTMRDQIVVENNKAGHQNLMFVGKEKKVYFGGTAGNIAYGLSKLNLKPTVVGVVGQDFDMYEKHLKSRGVNLKLKKDAIGFTSTFYAMTDSNKEQIGVFQPGVTAKWLPKLKLRDLLTEREIKSTSLAIFSAGTAQSIVKQMKEFRGLNKTATVIFDPGQMLAIDFTPSLLTDAFKYAQIGIFNDVECNTLHNKHGFDLKKIFSLGTKLVIETKGELGSSAYSFEQGEVKEIFIASKKVKAIDPTGAGDAFRAGFISEILKGRSIKDALKFANKIGALAVKYLGGQTY